MIDSNKWSAPIDPLTTTSYLPPRTELISRLQGGDKQISFSNGNGKPLLIPTKGYKVTIHGLYFGLPNNAQVIWDGNQKNGQYISSISNDIEQKSLTTYIPQGTGKRLRTVTVRTGQYSSDSYQLNFQVNGISNLAYRPPTIIDILTPLWRSDDNGKAGGYEVEIYGYDFAPINVKQWDNGQLKHEKTPYELTTVIYLDTPCKVIYSSYDRIKCIVGNIVTSELKPEISVSVDGQKSTPNTMAENNKINELIIKNEDELLTSSLMKERNNKFQMLVDANAVDAGGLYSAMSATRQASIEANNAGTATVSQRAMASNHPTSLQVKIIKAVMLIQSAMEKRCQTEINVETDESKAILNSAILYDQNTLVPPKIYGSNILDEFCSKDFIFGGNGGYGPEVNPEDPNDPFVPIGPSSQTGGSGQIISSQTQVGTPQIIYVMSSTNGVLPSALSTNGGQEFTVEGLNFDAKMSAKFVDPTGIYPPISVPLDLNKIVAPSPPFQFWKMTFITPPGQGKNLILQLTAGEQNIVSIPSGKDGFSYLPPSINITKTNIPLKSTTDSCKANQYETELAWAARIDTVLMEDREQNPELYTRKCLSHDTLTIYGENFGKDSKQLHVWVVGKSLLTTSNEKDLKKADVIFDIFNGTMYTTADIDDDSTSSSTTKSSSEDNNVIRGVLNRGFAGRNSKFSFEHEHNKIVVRGPKGYGQNLKLFIDVQGQRTSTQYSFLTPQADYSEPRSYDAQGEKITIHGQNFGGEPSDAKVMINNEECLNAKWYREHPIKGLPYISCNAQRTVAGVANVSVTVAGQTSNIVEIDSVERAGVRTVCKESSKESDIDLKTGKVKSYWGRNDPAGELCTICPEGASCINDYQEPKSIGSWYVQDLDISGGNGASDSIDFGS
jgi:hypothetical protein